MLTHSAALALRHPARCGTGAVRWADCGAGGMGTGTADEHAHAHVEEHAHAHELLFSVAAEDILHVSHSHLNAVQVCVHCLIASLPAARCDSCFVAAKPDLLARSRSHSRSKPNRRSEASSTHAKNATPAYFSLFLAQYCRSW